MLRVAISQYWLRIYSTYVLIAAELVCYLIRPMFLGGAIQELVVKHAIGMACVWFLCNEVLFCGLSIVKKFAKNYVFADVIANVGAEVARAGILAGKDTSKIQAQTFLARDYVRLFEYTFPKFGKELVTMSMSLFALAWFGWPIFAINMIMLVVGWLIIPRTLRTVQRCAKDRHDAMQQDVSVFAPREPESIRLHMLRYARIAVRWSNAEITCASWLDGIGSIIVVTSIALVCLFFGGDFQAAFAVHRYSANVVGNVEDIAVCLQECERAKDVLDRIQKED